MSKQLSRVEARRRIVQAANRRILAGRRMRGLYVPRLLSMRQLQRAVFVCRQGLLVSPDVLVTAGFRAKRSAR